MAIFNPPCSWEREAKAMFWILIDPLGWMVELAIFFQLDHPILPVIWSVRRVTTTGCLLTYAIDAPLKLSEMVWTLLMAAVMIIQIILNLNEEDHYVTLGTVLILLVNHVLGENKAESNADEVYQNNFMIPFIIVTLVRAFKKK